MRSVFTLNKVVDSILKEHTDISLSKLKILIALNKKPAFSQKEIAEFIGITEAAVSRQLEVMRKEGFIQCKNSLNEKGSKGNITSLGKEKLRKSLDLLDELLHKSFKHMEVAEKEKMTMFLEGFVKNIITDNPKVFKNV